MKLTKDDKSLSLAGVMNFLNLAGIDVELDEYDCSIENHNFVAISTKYGEKRKIILNTNLQDLVRVRFCQNNFYRQHLEGDSVFKDYKEIWFLSQTITEFCYQDNQVVVTQGSRFSSGINDTTEENSAGNYMEFDSIESMARTGNRLRRMIYPIDERFQLNDSLKTTEEVIYDAEKSRLESTYHYWRQSRGWGYNQSKSPYQKVKK